MISRKTTARLIFFGLGSIFLVAHVTAAPAIAPPSPGFERNVGQSAGEARFVAHSAGYAVGVFDDGVALRLVRRPRADDIMSQSVSVSSVVRFRLSGIADTAKLAGGAELPGVVNYLRGTDAAQWFTGLPRLESVRQAQVYEGIDLVYRSDAGHLRYDFVLAPGADASAIEIAVEGANSIALGSDGDLRIETAAGTLVQKAPVLYQQAGGVNKRVDGSVVLRGNRLRFAVSDYNRDAALVIDPTLVFGTYLGGGGNDAGSDVVTDAEGNIYLAGAGGSVDFPAPGGGVVAPAGGDDAFVAKYSGATGELLFVTYIGGSQEDRANVIELDAAGNIYVAGYTRSADFPAINAAQPVYAGGDSYPGSVIDAMDGFVLRLKPTGASLDYSTFLGGSVAPVNKSGLEWLRALHVSAAGVATVFGETGATDFPATDFINGRPCMQGDELATSSFVSDMIIARYDPAGSRQFAVCLGGSGRDAGRGVTVDADGSIVVAGFSRSEDMPVSAGAVQAMLASVDGFSYDGYVARLNATAGAVNVATYLGGVSLEYFQRVTIDGAGRIVVVGSSLSGDYPLTPDAAQSDFRGTEGLTGDAVLSVFDSTLSSLEYSTYFGGSGDESGWALDLDSAGRIVFAGTSTSRDLPVVSPIAPQPSEFFAAGVNIGAAGGGPESVAVADLDGDGHQDLVVGQNSAAPLLVYFNNGTQAPYAGVVPLTLGPMTDNTRRVRVADLNGDGFADLVTANQNGVNRLYLNNGTADPFSGVTPSAIGSDTDNTWSVTLADANRDERVDVFAANSDAVSRLYLNNGTAAPFAGVAGMAIGDAGVFTRAIAVGDINADGWPDVVLANLGQNQWLPGNGDLTLFDGAAPQAVGTETQDTWGVAVLDADGNGTVDVAFGNGGAVAQVDLLFLGNGASGAMTGVTGLQLGGAAAATFNLLAVDFNSDGQTDILAARGVAGGAANALLINNGGVFFARNIGDDIDESQDLAAGDIDGDGDQDVVAANAIGHPLKSYAGNSSADLFIGVLAADYSAVEFASTLGGSGTDLMVWGLHVDAQDNAWVTGNISSWDAPTPGGTARMSTAGDDAWLVQLKLFGIDTDGDGIFDADDNCTLLSNPDQRDTNGDGFGNVCDADLNNDGAINFLDLAQMRASFFLSAGDVGYNEDADIDGDDTVNFVDVGAMKSAFFGVPGPAGNGIR